MPSAVCLCQLAVLHMLDTCTSCAAWRLAWALPTSSPPPHILRRPHPLCSGPEELVAQVAAALPAHAKLAVFDAVTSNTAIVLPIRELVQLCHSRQGSGVMERKVEMPAGLPSSTAACSCCVRPHLLCHIAASGERSETEVSAPAAAAGACRCWLMVRTPPASCPWIWRAFKPITVWPTATRWACLLFVCCSKGCSAAARALFWMASRPRSTQADRRGAGDHVPPR